MAVKTRAFKTETPMVAPINTNPRKQLAFSKHFSQMQQTKLIRYPNDIYLLGDS